MPALAAISMHIRRMPSLVRAAPAHPKQHFSNENLPAAPAPCPAANPQTDADRASESYAALERKAALYERLARGEAADDEEKYEVDFLMKGRYAEAPDTVGLAVYTETGAWPVGHFMV